MGWPYENLPWSWRRLYWPWWRWTLFALVSPVVAWILWLILNPPTAPAPAVDASGVTLPTYASTTTIPEPGANPCGGHEWRQTPQGAYYGVTPPVYQPCSFSDDFDGTALSPNRWTVIRTSDYGYHSGNECVVNDPDNLQVDSGTLKLRVVQEVAPFTCDVPEAFGQDYTTSWTGASISSYGHYAQRWGRYEWRARFPQTTAKGLQSTLWLVAKDQLFGRWPRSGEIDVAEWYSEYSGLVIPVVHWRGETANAHAQANCAIDNGQWHTYVAEWYPRFIRLRVDGVLCVESKDWAAWGKPGGITPPPTLPDEALVAPRPFSHPYTINMTAVLGMLTNALDPANPPPFPATTEIDYVYVWGWSE